MYCGKIYSISLDHLENPWETNLTCMNSLFAGIYSITKGLFFNGNYTVLKKRFLAVAFFLKSSWFYEGTFSFSMLLISSDWSPKWIPWGGLTIVINSLLLWWNTAGLSWASGVKGQKLITALKHTHTHKHILSKYTNRKWHLLRSKGESDLFFSFLWALWVYANWLWATSSLNLYLLG